MVEIKWTKEAKNWLRDIFDYISTDSPNIAKKVINDIYNKVQILSTFSKVGYLYSLTDENQEIRILLYGHYRIAYLIKDKNTIDILGVFHGAMIMQKYLEKKETFVKTLFLIIGAPGSGKTTDAEIVSKNNPELVTHYSTGDMLRAEAASGSEIGEIIKKRIDNGELVPVEIAAQTIIKAINNAKTPIVIIDGYPRSMEQLLALDSFLNEQDSIVLKKVIEVVVSQEVAKERVLGRARGADDDEKVFAHRMKVYLEPLDEIQKFYEEKNFLVKINGEGTIEKVVAEMEKIIISEQLTANS
jgi:adenylate kinase